MERIMGIDPGKSGGCAILEVSGSVIEVFKFGDLTPQDLAHKMRPYQQVKMAYIEKVHSMPGQGVRSVFTFGQNYGMLLGVLAAFRFATTHVAPQVWQKYLQCMSKGNKNVTKQRAQELFPAEKITHAVADALLIAEYGRRQALKFSKVADL